MTKLIKTSLLLAILALPLPHNAKANDYKPDDMVAFNISAEGWVSTKSARVSLSVEAAVSGNSAGTMRTNMTKAVNDIVKADWRLISFNRSQDQTGLERWSAVYEARVLESELNGLHEKAKTTSKAGMQISISDIDFSPTLEETQATMAQLRTQLFKQANEQLAVLNSTIPGRNYRIGTISFGGQARSMVMGGMADKKGGRAHFMTAMAEPEMAMDSAAPMERAEKITLTADIVYAALPTSPAK